MCVCECECVCVSVCMHVCVCVSVHLIRWHEVNMLTLHSLDCRD